MEEVLAWASTKPLKSAAAGDAITIDSTAHTVRVIQSEYTGVTTLVLEKN